MSELMFVLGYDFLLVLKKSMFYAVIGMLFTRLMKKNYSNVLFVVPIIVLLLCLPLVSQYLFTVLQYLVETVEQYKRVSGFSSDAYAKYMSYLYLEPLGKMFIYMIPMIPSVIAPIVSYIDYRKHKKEEVEHETLKQQEDEIRKMKIQDL